MSTRSRRSADSPILIVEDKDSLRTMLRHALEAQGHTVIEARDQPEAEAALHATLPGVVLSDLRLTVGDGFGVLRASKDIDPQLPVIVMTAFGSIQDAVIAMKEGALDFLAKPVDPDHLLLMVERALSQRRLATENMILKDELAQRRFRFRLIARLDDGVPLRFERVSQHGAQRIFVLDEQDRRVSRAAGALAHPSTVLGMILSVCRRINAASRAGRPRGALLLGNRRWPSSRSRPPLSVA